MKRKRGFFYKVGDAVLKARLPSLRWGVKRLRSVEAEPKIPAFLKGYFERRQAGWPEYLMFKVQAGVVVLFIAVVLYFLIFPGVATVFIPLLLALSGLLVYVTLTQLKKAFGSDYPAYRAFVFMSLGIAWIFVIALRYFQFRPHLESIQVALAPPLFAIASVFLFFLMFRLKYGRNFTFGVVESVRGHQAMVRVGYDICSNVKAGLYRVESFTSVKPGDFVKLSVDRPLLGLRGSKVIAVLEKVHRNVRGRIGTFKRGVSKLRPRAATSTSRRRKSR